MLSVCGEHETVGQLHVRYMADIVSAATKQSAWDNNSLNHPKKAFVFFGTLHALPPKDTGLYSRAEKAVRNTLGYF